MFIVCHQQYLNKNQMQCCFLPLAVPEDISNTIQVPLDIFILLLLIMPFFFTMQMPSQQNEISADV